MGNNKIFLRKTFPMTMIKKSKTKSNIVNQMRFLTFLAFCIAKTQFIKQLKKKKRKKKEYQ
jgi:hypothetical protein